MYDRARLMPAVLLSAVLCMLIGSGTFAFDPAEVPFSVQEQKGKSALVRDDILRTQVYALTDGTTALFTSNEDYSGAYRVEALVRLPYDGDARRIPGKAVLRCGMQEVGGVVQSAYSLDVSRYGEYGAAVVPSIGANERWVTYSGDKKRPGGYWQLQRIVERFPASSISPVMDEEFRLALERDLASLTPGAQVWRRLRIDVRGDTVRIYHNGLLLAADRAGRDADGKVSLSLVAPAMLASLTVTPLTDEPAGLYPVPLDTICNATGPVDAKALPANVDGVPFVTSTGAKGQDHVDVGASVFRYRRFIGYRPGADPSYIFPQATVMDPARLTLRVPNRAWGRAYVLAAADDDPNSVPRITVRFYKPAKGWTLDAGADVPAFTATTAPEGAKRVTVPKAGGGKLSLWMLPIDLDAAALASDFREEPIFHIELTKQIADFVAFPDPAGYGYMQAGLPSAVRLYGLTLEEAPVFAYATGSVHANVYPYPQQPLWQVHVTGQSAKDVPVEITCNVTSPEGKKQTLRRRMTIAAGADATVNFEPKTAEYGLYRVTTEVATNDYHQSRDGSFLTLPPEHRSAGPNNSPWGIWCWFGAHDTQPNGVENVRLMKSLGIYHGAKLNIIDPNNGIQRGRATGPYLFRKHWQIGAAHHRLVPRRMPAWSRVENIDPKDYAAYREEKGQEAADLLAVNPDLQYVNAFAENRVSLRTTHGLPPYAFGEPWFEYDEREKVNLRSLFAAAHAAVEGVREKAPKLKFIFGHGTPCFPLPFFRERDWDDKMFDAFGLDMPQFERMPERPPRATEPNMLYFLYKEMKDRGMTQELIHLESYFPSSHPLALGHRQQANSIVRTAVLSMALGTDKFFDTWSLHDCEDRWGSQHYGCVGLISRKPEFNPKPAAAAYATMSRVIDLAKYDTFLDVGSRSAYCVRFRDKGRTVYCLWTIRGSRPIALTTDGNGTLTRIDENGNETPLAVENNAATVTVTPTPIWVEAQAMQITAAKAGAPTYTEAPGKFVAKLEDFEKADWAYHPEEYPRFQENHWDVRRAPGKMASARVKSDERKSTVWRVELTERPEGKPFVGWYGTFTPAEPIVIPGKARALALYAKGNSGWGRFAYVLEDAKGETFLSCGMKDQWNCDDTHSWSYFNFDGWRMMEFPLPANMPGDDYREKNNPWWGYDAEGIVDLPLKLKRIVIEMPTQQIYVNELMPVPDMAVEIDDVMALYDSADMMTDAPIAQQRAAAGMLRPKTTGGEGLPNPITDLSKSGKLAAPKIAKLAPPTDRYDGTLINVHIDPVADAEQYQVWVSAYPDGRGAQVMAKGASPVLLVRRLKPELSLWFYATYTKGRTQSKPSASVQTVLKDEFPMK